MCPFHQFTKLSNLYFKPYGWTTDTLAEFKISKRFHNGEINIFNEKLELRSHCILRQL